MTFCQANDAWRKLLLAFLFGPFGYFLYFSRA